MYQIWTLIQANQSDWPKKKSEEMPHKSDSNYHKGSTLSLSPPKSIYRYCTRFPPKHFLFYYFCLCGNSFLQSQGEKERYTHLNAEFQRTARRDKAFLSDQ